VLILLAIALGALWVLIQLSPWKLAARVAPAIADFTGEAGLRVRELREEETSLGQMVQYQGQLKSGELALFDVDNKGNVVGFFRQYQPGMAVTISLETAQQVADSFVRQHYTSPSLIEGPPDTAELVGSIEGVRFYRFVWFGSDAETGSLLPQQVCVEVSAQNGQVDGYYALDQAVTVSARPQVDRQTAEQAALGIVSSGEPLPAVERYDLVITTVPLLDPEGKQALVWRFTLAWPPDESGYTPMLDVIVDAQTGELLSVEPY
jgi:hypothetical protein